MRMMVDNSATYIRALGQEVDLTERDMGECSRRFSMLADDGVIRVLHVEAPGKFEVSNAQTMLSQL